MLGTSFGDALQRWVEALQQGRWAYDKAKRAEYPKGSKPNAGHAAYAFARR